MAVGSFSAGLSGLNANGQYLSVIGNNLANINTVGFKASTVNFMDLVSQTVGGSSSNPMQVGLGVVTGAISPTFSQGAIENTREATNVAIQGNGFFIVRGSDTQSYTRAGNFSLNAEGKLVSPEGLFVQGYTAVDPVTGKIVTTGPPSDILVTLGALRAPDETTSMSTQINLKATATVGDIYTTTLQIYDTLGAPHNATVTFTRTGAGTWDYDMSVPGEDVTGPDPAGLPVAPVSVQAGTLEFGPDGALALLDGAAPADVAVATPAWFNGAAAGAINWDVVNDAGVASLTGYAADSAASYISQNGSAPGKVGDITIMADGSIVAPFGAGQTVSLGQLAMASFNNPKGLIKLGSSRFGESQSAGVANVGVAGTGGRGTLIGSALEQSNVDIAQEFTQMILAQRGYQANSKTITVSDELLVDTLALKR